MNDLITCQGNKTKECDLGLPLNRSLNVKWPSPNQIAAASKRDSYPLTFRIDEVAYACLDLLSKQCDMSMNSFVNELINSYINQNRASIDGLIFNRALNAYMERLVAKLLRLSDSEIVRDFHLPIVKEVFRFNKMEFPKDKAAQNAYFKTFYQDMLNTGNDRLINLLISSSDLYLRLVPNDRKSQVYDMRRCTPDEQNSVGFADYALTVPLTKWVAVSTLLSEYSQKVRQLFNNKNLLSGRDLTKIADIINQYDGADLITKLAAALKLPEQFNFGGSNES